MRCLFYYMAIKNDKGYFFERDTNTLVEVNRSDNSVARTLSMKRHFDRSGGIGDIDIKGDSLILYPAWSDSIIVMDLNDWTKIDKIYLEYSSDDGLWCDYQPIFVDDERSYICRGRKECEIYEVDIVGRRLKRVELEMSGDRGSFKGCRRIYACSDGRVLTTSYEDSDCFADISIDKNKLEIHRTGCGNVRNAIFRNGYYWLVNDEGNIYIWSSEHGVVKTIEPCDKEDQYQKKELRIFETTEMGVLIAGLYRDGSFLVINDDFTQERADIDGLKYSKDASELADNVYVQGVWAWNRSFIQLKTGAYAYGDDLRNVYKPVEISIKDLELDMVRESRDYTLKSFIREIM